jgi:nitrate/TMAO reductase-like tetraheme cytochrome c subunit
MRRLIPSSFYNIASLVGFSISAVSLGLIVFLTVVEFFAEEQKPYMGIVAFLILPVFLIIGLIVGIAGMIREQWRTRLGRPHGLALPIVDFNNSKHRTAVTVLVGGVLLLLGFSGFGSFKAYEYTNSDAFCGEVCHAVMNPEFVAYQYSPHAKVGCAQCHIGSGATWFVRSKLSGAYQVYATMFDAYPRPIPTPIRNLRPAQETCEECHWPMHFFSEKLHVNTYYLSDEANTKWTLNLLMKIGGGDMEVGPTSGIHWHMNIAHEVTYAALDTQRQVIAWVKAKTPDGAETLYRNTGIETSEEELANVQVRRMDCIDCHNRPTHIYRPPGRSVNHALSLGWIDAELPGVKSIAVEVLEQEYGTKDEGLQAIRETIQEFYESEYPEVIDGRREAVDEAIQEVQKIFSRNYFPEMKVDWRRFIDNIGHLYYPGCFRCHDGAHVSDDGEVLSRDCNVCHTILAQDAERGSERISLGGVEYVHPEDIGDIWKEMNCNDCHNSQ